MENSQQNKSTFYFQLWFSTLWFSHFSLFLAVNFTHKYTSYLAMYSPIPQLLCRVPHSIQCAIFLLIMFPVFMLVSVTCCLYSFSEWVTFGSDPYTLSLCLCPYYLGTAPLRHFWTLELCLPEHEHLEHLPASHLVDKTMYSEAGW